VSHFAVYFVGEISQIFSLHPIIVTISAPSGHPRALLAIEILSANVTLTWSEIDCLDRNGVITNYVIQYRREGASYVTVNTLSNSTTHVMTGLDSYTVYTFTVAGVNSISTGPFSDSITVRTSKFNIQAIISVCCMVFKFSMVFISIYYISTIKDYRMKLPDVCTQDEFHLGLFIKHQ